MGLFKAMFHCTDPQGVVKFYIYNAIWVGGSKYGKKCICLFYKTVNTYVGGWSKRKMFTSYITSENFRKGSLFQPGLQKAMQRNSIKNHCDDSVLYASKCIYWKRHGECTKSVEFMEMNCKRTCNLCPGM